MNYGLYLSATGVQTSLHRQDVHANNLANVQTIGFKPDAVYTRERLPERIESNDPWASPMELLEQLGGGHLANPTRTLLTQGSLEPTGAPLDVALDGEGFLAVQSGNGETLYTRDGRLNLNADGELVLASNGMKVLNAQNRPIRLDPTAQLTISQDGAIQQNGTEHDRLSIMDAVDPAAVRKQGQNLYVIESVRLGTAQVQQGYTETSAANPIQALMSMTNAAKAVSANARMMQYHDHNLEELFGRVARVG
ncbi:MAG: flagellar hook-basal body protein [Planctomycetota bacterium]